jgi:hypothetical protein
MRQPEPAQSAGAGAGRPAVQFSESPRRLTGLCVFLLLVVGACESKPGSYRAAIQSANPDERILGIRAAAEAKDPHAVALLVDRLEDEDEAVRFFAIIALDKMTGQRFGYDYALPASQRARAVELWREYVRRGAQTALSSASSSIRSPMETAVVESGVREPMP